LSNPQSATVEHTLAYLVSTPRWKPYLHLAADHGGDPFSAYVHNLNVSAALLRLVAIGEVVLRNALDRQLEHAFGSDRHWAEALDDILEARALNEIRVATSRAKQAAGGATRGHVTAHLNLGFWTYLLSKPYKDSLWIPALRHAFPHLRPQVRDRAYKQARRMLDLRNRVAHHETVIGRHPEAEGAAILELLGWIDPLAASWAAEVVASPIPGVRVDSLWGPS